MGLIEIIVLNDEDARVAEAFGADRLELVSAMTEGGLTPSYGTIKNVVNSVSIPVMIMVRPHSFSFQYRKEEWQTFREDIKAIRDLGAAGIVFGAITNRENIDFELLAMVLEEAKGLQVTFHRAIDEGDPLSLYKSLIQSGYKIDRVLTSGGKPTVREGIETIQNMIEESHKTATNPIIMPGSGLSLENITYIHNQLHAAEYHFGSAARIEGKFYNLIQGDKIKKIREIVQKQ